MLVHVASVCVLLYHLLKVTVIGYNRQRTCMCSIAITIRPEERLSRDENFEQLIKEAENMMCLHP